MIDNVLRIDITLAYERIKKAETPLQALMLLSRFNEWFYGMKPFEARLYAWCMWLKDKGYEEWVRYIGLMSRTLNALTSGDPNEIEYYTRKLKEVKKPKGWIDDFRDYLLGKK